MTTKPDDALARRLGPFDATMLVMGGIIGAGIFINPYVVAQRLHTPALIMGAWAAGGVIALLGAFIYARSIHARSRKTRSNHPRCWRLMGNLFFREKYGTCLVRIH